MFDIPIVFVIFNRPDTTAISFAQIRRLRPLRLFIVADGPRADRLGEADQVARTRDVAMAVDWPCQVTSIFADENMGCGRRVSTGISAAMESVDRLIVLEDDCIADASFFSYSAEMLTRYADDQRVMAVSGNNHQLGRRHSAASYYFSKYPHCWGWATWRRAWKHFDLRVPAWPAFRDAGGLAAICDSDAEQEYWTEIFDKVHAGRSKSWAFPWVLACWMQHGLTVLPEVNLVSNIGFGDDATHTHRKTKVAGLKTQPLGPIVHPDWVSRNVAADRFTDQLMFSGTVRRDLFKRVERAVKKLRRAA
jgi:hypothetical protein